MRSHNNAVLPVTVVGNRAWQGECTCISNAHTVELATRVVRYVPISLMDEAGPS
jgi:hypothetical protein